MLKIVFSFVSANSHVFKQTPCHPYSIACWHIIGIDQGLVY